MKIGLTSRRWERELEGEDEFHMENLSNSCVETPQSIPGANVNIPESQSQCCHSYFLHFPDD